MTNKEVQPNNKIEDKTSDLIIKYLEKNEWVISNKGTMVSQNKLKDDNEIDPFS